MACYSVNINVWSHIHVLVLIVLASDLSVTSFVCFFSSFHVFDASKADTDHNGQNQGSVMMMRVCI